MNPIMCRLACYGGGWYFGYHNYIEVLSFRRYLNYTIFFLVPNLFVLIVCASYSGRSLPEFFFSTIIY